MRISIVAGVRPNFMKIAPLVRAFRNSQMQTRIIHTGQHYDEKMSQTFFDELNIPQPHINLNVGSGPHVLQMAEVMRRLLPEFESHHPDLLVVVGDVNSTVAAALTATKLGIPVAHVEAGLRSFDRSMPEETNRIVTDAVSDILFASEPAAMENLIREGIDKGRVHLVGNVMIDTLQTHLSNAIELRTHEQFGLEEKNYALLTLHRPSNVDDPQRLESILMAVHAISRILPVVFSIHPRTRSRLDEFNFNDRSDLNGYVAVEPQGYLAMLGLMNSARLVLTDSGGIQEETTALRIPCITLRENTERPVTVDVGSNRLIGWKTQDILHAVEDVLNHPQRIGQIPDLWDGCAAERIAELLKSDFDSRLRK